ncbi:MAG: endonuclease/exonuclease/phosphatase family protein [Gammaproteobacteria bacterium]|nr:endonuclease/exonuclease/phosphatase family protein [Gammaproteobacteria bacterium]
MRVIVFLSSLLLAVLVAGCVAAAAHQPQPDIATTDETGQSGASCDVGKLVQGDFKGRDGGSQGLNPQKISILNWNIYKGQRDNWATDFRRYSHAHDVVTIQEAHLDDELRSLLDHGQRFWTLNTAFHYQDRATGVMTASRVRPLHSCGQSTVEPWIRFPKTTLVSYYPLEGLNENLLVANIHGVNFTLGVSAYREQIEKLFETMKHHRGPVVLAGDFNTWSDERMTVVLDLAERLSLESLDYTNHNRTSVFGNALDHVFYRGLEPMEHDTWFVTSSDHNPTRVSFRVIENDASDIGLAEAELDEDNC